MAETTEQVTIDEEQLMKAVEKLENSQITTGPGSSKGNLDEMNPETYGDGWDDDIDDNGTDYNHRGKVSKAMKNRDDDDDNDRDYVDPNASKSLPSPGNPSQHKKSGEHRGPGRDENESKSGSLKRSMDFDVPDEAYEGLEVSEFIFFLNKSFNDAMADMSQRIVNRALSYQADRGEYANVLAEAIAEIDGNLGKSISVVETEEGKPAYVAKSVTKTAEVTNESGNGAAIQKSLAQRFQDKQRNLNALTELVKSGTGSVNPLDIVKYETSNEISPALQGVLDSLNR